MAILDGQINTIPSEAMAKEDRKTLSGDLWGFDPAIYLDLSTVRSGDLTNNENRTIQYPPVHAPGLSGSVNNHYVQDYYYRVHIKPNPIDVRNLLSPLTRDFYVWNAHLTSQTLSRVTQQDVDGISLTQPQTAPTDFAPLEERIYSIQVTLDGPPAIDADIIFDFPSENPVLSILGQRVVLWRWIPQQGYTETLAWLTKILKTRRGEQRIALRKAPRQMFDYQFLKQAHEFSQIKAYAEEWSHRLWGLPIWHEQETASASVGDVAVDFDTTNQDYRADGLAVLWQSPDSFEVFEISAVRTDGLDLKKELENDWADATVMPVRYARIQDGISITRRTGQISRLSASFLVTDNADLSGTASYPTYKGYDVLNDGNIIISSMDERIVRPVIEFDNGQGPVEVETKQDYTNHRQTMGKLTRTKTARWEWRQWLHSRYGKQKAFWVPTWNRDITVVSHVFDTELEIEIKDIGISLYMTLPLYIRIKLTNGTIMYREITAASRNVTTETITIDSTIGDYDPEDFAMICFMRLCRFDADKIEMNHISMQNMETSAPIMRVQDDI